MNFDGDKKNIPDAPSAVAAPEPRYIGFAYQRSLDGNTFSLRIPLPKHLYVQPFFGQYADLTQHTYFTLTQVGAETRYYKDRVNFYGGADLGGADHTGFYSALVGGTDVVIKRLRAANLAARVDHSLILTGSARDYQFRGGVVLNLPTNDKPRGRHPRRRLP